MHQPRRPKGARGHALRLQPAPSWFQGRPTTHHQHGLLLRTVAGPVRTCASAASPERLLCVSNTSGRRRAHARAREGRRHWFGRRTNGGGDGWGGGGGGGRREGGAAGSRGGRRGACVRCRGVVVLFFLQQSLEAGHLRLELSIGRLRSLELRLGHP